MEKTLNNPQIDLEKLNALYKSIECNTATSSDYESLDFLLSSLGLANYILNLLKQNNFDTYESYIIERKKPIGTNNRLVEGMLLGSILGAISAMKDFMSNKI